MIATAALSTGLFFLGSLIIWRADKFSFSNERLPWGTLWLTSFFVYLFGPAISNALFNISIFSDIPEIHRQILERKLLTAALLCFGFSLSYGCLSATYCNPAKARQGTFRSSKPRKDSRNTNQPIAGFLIYIGLTAIASLSASHLLDGFDRYNSGALEFPIARLFQSTGLITVTLYYFFYELTSLFISRLELRSAIGPSKSHPAKTRIDLFSKATLTCIALVLLALVVKTGSRSMLLGCILSAFFAYFIKGRLQAKSLLYGLILLLAVSPILATSFEAIRVARSESVFYKANPAFMARQLTSSFDFSKGVLNFVYANRREEFSEASFIDPVLCRDALLKHSGSLNIDQHKRLRSCSTDFRERYRNTNPLSANGYLSRMFKTEEPYDYSGFILTTAKSADAVSKGERINLSGDLYLRGGHIANFIGGIILGAAYLGASAITTAFGRILCNRWSKLVSRAIPLGLTSGALMLTVDGQLWLAAFQLPKTFLVAYAVGKTFSLIKDLANGAKQFFRRLSK